MKKQIYLLTLIALLVLMSGKSFSQNYLSLFGNNSTNWDIIPAGYCDVLCSQTFAVNGDTTIGSKTYKVLSGGMGGFLREDIVQGKAWYFDPFFNSEYLIMDFNLNLGDPFNIYDYFNMPSPCLVDSIYYINGKKFVRINALTIMCSLTEKITFIEGSGTTAGFSYQRNFNGFSVPSYMLCHHKDGIKVAGNNLIPDSCSICDVGIAKKNPIGNPVRIFPNPAFDELKVEVDPISTGDSFLSISDLIGRQLYTEKVKQQVTTIDISNLAGGVYFVIVNDGRSNKYQRFVKK